MEPLWNKQSEIDFFQKSLEVATPEKLFYVTKDRRYLAYWPKNYDGPKATLQSRNAFIGSYTEKWGRNLFGNFAKEINVYAVDNVICEDIGLSNASPADVAICTTEDSIQKPENILLIIEVKMSVVWNWELRQKRNKYELTCIGDFRTHQGNPGLLRSDTMLKATGKSINIRVCGYGASKIPIIVLGNTPITGSYYSKVDHLRRCGVIQGFWSVNPAPLDNEGENIKNTPFRGFYRFDTIPELREETLRLLKEEREYFSSMQTKKNLGQVIEMANREDTYEKKAEKFLELIREEIKYE